MDTEKWGELMGAIGRIEANGLNTKEHLLAVNAKLTTHLIDPDAHVQIERRRSNNVITWVVAGVAVLSLLLSVIHEVRGAKNENSPAGIVDNRNEPDLR